MGDTGGEQGERVQSLALNRFFRCPPALSDVAHDNGVADLLRCRRDCRSPVRTGRTVTGGVGYRRISRLDDEGHDVKVDEPISRIKNFQVAGDRTAAVGQRVPIETPHSFVELFADRIFARESKKLAGRVV